MMLQQMFKPDPNSSFGLTANPNLQQGRYYRKGFLVWYSKFDNIKRFGQFFRVFSVFIPEFIFEAPLQRTAKYKK